MSRRVRPWLSRAMVPVEVCLIWFPSASVSVDSVVKLALNGAPVTTLSPSPASKPNNRISSRPGPCPYPWPGGGGGGGADAASCARKPAPASSRIIATLAVANNFVLCLISSSSDKLIVFLKIRIGIGVRIRLRHQPNRLWRPVLADHHIRRHLVSHAHSFHRQTIRNQRRPR